MRIEVKNFKRQKLFDTYHKMTNPYIYLTTKIDVTKIINYCKKHKNYYATIGYFILAAANSLDCFKYRLEDDKIYKYDSLKSSSVELLENDDIIYVNCDFNSYDKYINNYLKEKERCISNKEVVETKDQGVIWFSCTPWFSYESLISPYDKNITIPQFIWDKYEKSGEKYFMNLTIMIHHGFADGKDIAGFLDILKDKINNIDKITKEVC